MFFYLKCIIGFRQAVHVKGGNIAVSIAVIIPTGHEKLGPVLVDLSNDV